MLRFRQLPLSVSHRSLCPSEHGLSFFPAAELQKGWELLLSASAQWPCGRPCPAEQQWCVTNSSPVSEAAGDLLLTSQSFPALRSPVFHFFSKYKYFQPSFLGK